MRGTLLNTATVAVGATIGLLVGSLFPERMLQMAQIGLGLVTMGLGLKLFFQGKNVLIVAAAVALGGMFGAGLGIEHGLAAFAEWARAQLGGGGTFNEALITTSVLFCVGPMTLLGCIQDGVEGKIELLSIKSLMDGIAAIFFAAALGPGVFVTAAVVLVFQGVLTLLARPLQGLSKRPELLAETEATGGAILLAIGLGLLEVADIPTENFLPALALAPAFGWAVAKLARPTS